MIFRSPEVILNQWNEESEGLLEALQGLGLCALWAEENWRGRPYVYLKYAWVSWRVEAYFNAGDGTWDVEVHSDAVLLQNTRVTGLPALISHVIGELRGRW